MSSAEVKMAYADTTMFSALAGVFTCSSLSVPCGVCSSRKSEQLLKAQITLKAQKILNILFMVVAV
jgi:hypothetical protein